MTSFGRYRIRNWKDYNKSLIQRGSINIWISDDSVKNWFAPRESQRVGRPFTYSDTAILTSLMIRSVFHLPLRGLEGFLSSIIQCLRVDLLAPSYTQISRRARQLGQQLELLSRKKITDIVIDSTGLKVYGEGEWKVRQHGYSKRRTWRKLHLAVCPDSHEIVFEMITDNETADCEVYPKFLEKAPKHIERTYGDGAYDKRCCYQANREHGSKPIIPPQRNAIIRKNPPSSYEERNNSVMEIIGLGGDQTARGLWKRLKNYHRRSLAETAMYRFKQLFGNKLRSRELSRQRAEARAMCQALNIMTRIGMPKGEWVAA